MFVSMVTVSKHTLVGNTSVHQNTPLTTEMKQCYIVYSNFISFFLYAIYNTLTEQQFIKKKILKASSVSYNVRPNFLCMVQICYFLCWPSMQNGQKICFDIIGSFIFELKRNIQMLCFHWKRRNSYVNDLDKKILQSEFTLVCFYNFAPFSLDHYSSVDKIINTNFLFNKHWVN